MTKRERIKDMIERIREHIENAKSGLDVTDQHFILKYRNGQIAYIEECDIPERLCLNVSKIAYAVAQDECDSFDTEGKSWFIDFAHGHWDCMKGMVFDPNDNPESLAQWDEYVSTMLEK